jgi:hypothetical protein
MNPPLSNNNLFQTQAHPGDPVTKNHSIHQRLTINNFILAIHLTHPATIVFIQQLAILRWQLSTEPLKNFTRLFPPILETPGHGSEFHHGFGPTDPE